MSAITKMSAKGQVVIPKDVRERLNWREGTALKVIDAGNGVTLLAVKNWLKPSKPFPRTTTADLHRFPKWEGQPFSVEEISSLSPDTLRRIFAEQERDEGD